MCVAISLTPFYISFFLLHFLFYINLPKRGKVLLSFSFFAVFIPTIFMSMMHIIYLPCVHFLPYVLSKLNHCHVLGVCRCFWWFRNLLRRLSFTKHPCTHNKPPRADVLLSWLSTILLSKCTSLTKFCFHSTISVFACFFFWMFVHVLPPLAVSSEDLRRPICHLTSKTHYPAFSLLPKFNFIKFYSSSYFIASAFASVSLDFFPLFIFLLSCTGWWRSNHAGPRATRTWASSLP